MKWGQTIFGALLALSLVLLSGGNAWASSNEQLKWIEGGRKIDLGKMATVELESSLLFLDAANTAKVSEMNHEKPSGKEIGVYFRKMKIKIGKLFLNTMNLDTSRMMKKKTSMRMPF
jgi:intein-encoded DNA endonuclease-like protein